MSARTTRSIYFAALAAGIALALVVAAAAWRSKDPRGAPEAGSALDPVLAARAGAVNERLGEREDVLFVNGRAGERPSREVRVGAREPIEVRMEPPSSRTSARFALYAWTGEPGAGTLALGHLDLGTFVFPAPPTRKLVNPALGADPEHRTFVVWNNSGNERWLGPPDLPSRPAPSTVVRRPRGLSRAKAATFTLQGIIEDDGSANPAGWSVTNAVVVRVLPSR